jgi:colanic acid biosynthesis glycosyl transferase WcaI
MAKKPDIIFCYSPPLPLGITAWLLSRFRHIKWIFRVEDLFPDAAVAAGVLNNQVVISFLSKMEKWLYRKADHISLISEGFRKNLLAKGLPNEKVSVAPVWADPDVITPLPKENNFRQIYGLLGKFVVLYAGNLGFTSALEDVIAAASLLKDELEIVFLLVGEGVKKAALVQKAQDLSQVVFLPYQPRSSVGEMMSAADISLVTLNAKSSPYSLPSKVFNIMASGRPLLAITPDISEVAQLVELAQCGCNILPGYPEELAKKILEIKQNPKRQAIWGENGRSYLLNHFSRKICLDMFESTLQQAVV